MKDAVIDLRAHYLWVQDGPGIAQLIELSRHLEGVALEHRGRRGCRAFGEGPEKRRARHARAHHVQLIVEHENVRGHAVAGKRLVFQQLVLVNVEKLPVDFIHGEEACGDAARGAEELAPAHAELLAGEVGQFPDAEFDPLLLLSLGNGHVLAVRYHLSRDRRVEVVGLVRP